MNRKILILGGGVAGSSMAYFLTEKGYDVTVIEKNSHVGGLARTCYYGGHPYEFGPHIWFWPGGPEDPINSTIVRLTHGELFHIDRRLFTYVESDRRKYRYPVHYQDIDEMPEREAIHRELRRNRDEHLKLIGSRLPELGQCTFGDYFTAAIGPTLYEKFMADYTWKMWNIPGNVLETSMVWADRFYHTYTEKDGKTRGLADYDPIKFDDHTLG
jgi:UDP-galactopyranose mutase